MVKWTREEILRDILRREAAGLSLAPGGKDGVAHTLYAAAQRIFGSWRNAVTAAGIPPARAFLKEQWTAAKVLTVIRSFARKRRPLRLDEARQRYGYLVRAAKRHFGSWSLAVVAAGVDPTRLSRVTTWTRDRIIEAILTRALKNEPLGSQTVQPKSLSAAGARYFGTWGAALAAAGIDPRPHVFRWPGGTVVGAEREPMTGEPPQAADPLQQSAEPQAAGMPPSDGPGNLLVLAPNIAAVLRRTGQVWSDQGVLQAIRARLREHQAMNSTAVYDEDRALYRAATRRHGNWSNALLAAGLNPDEFRKPGGRPRVR